MNRLKLARRILPGFGFFAKAGPLKKVIPIQAPLRRIRISCTFIKPRKLFVPVITLTGRDGNPIDKSRLIKEVRVTSCVQNANEDELRDCVVRGKFFATEREMEPAIEIVFAKPRYVNELKLGNRNIGLGKNSRPMHVEGFRGGQLVFQHSNLDPQAWVTALETLCDKLDIELPPEGEPVKIKGLLNEVQARVIDSLDEGSDLLTAPELINMMPVFKRQQEFTPFKSRLSAEALARLLEDRTAIATSTLAPMRAILNTPDKIEQVCKKTNAVLQKRTGMPKAFFASKHSIHESRLIRNKDAYLEALDALFPALEACGVKGMLSYGTLLGAVRDNGFLAHDDDVDLLYFDGSRSREEMLKNRDALIAKLGNFGFRKHRGSPKYENCHLVWKDLSLDLFPCWSEGDDLMVMRKYPTYEPVPANLILPTSDIDFYGRTFAAPAQKEQFLEWRYGADWSTPNPYYDWPWTLKDEADNAEVARPSPSM